MGRLLRLLAIATLLIGYPFLAHYTNTYAQGSNLGAFIAITPVTLLAFVFAWRSPRRILMLTLWALACLALWFGWAMLENHFGLVYWLQNMSMQLVLLLMFGRTLMAGRQPLCTRFAEAVHTEPLSARHERYARHVTVAWSVFFAAMAIVSSLLFFLTPLTTWSFFANFLTLPLVALMFVVEFGVRRTLFPDLEQAHILDAVKAFRNASARSR